MNANSETQYPLKYEPFGPVPWVSIASSVLLSIALAISIAIHTAYTLGLYNNYWEELYLIGAIFSIVVSVLGTVWTQMRVLLIDSKRIMAILVTYSGISVFAFIYFLHIRESQIAWIIPMWTSIHAIPLALVSAFRNAFVVDSKPSCTVESKG